MAPTTTTTTLTEVEQQQAAWEALAIDDYRMVYWVQNLNGMGGSDGDGTYTLTVVDDLIASCELEPNFEGDDCDHMVGFEDSALFDWATRFDPTHTVISYNPEWHLPSRISYDDPEWVDEEYVVELLEFEASP